MFALILGGANTIWDDYAAAKKCIEPDIIIAINDIGVHFEHIDHWVTMHPEKMPNWLAARRKNYEFVPRLWTAGHKLPTPRGFIFNHVWSKGGSSGMLAVRVARHIRCKKILLAGVPMESRYAHFFDSNGWTECDYYKRAWEREWRTGMMKDVRSVSGWTKTLLGAPDADWCRK